MCSRMARSRPRFGSRTATGTYPSRSPAACEAALILRTASRDLVRIAIGPRRKQRHQHDLEIKHHRPMIDVVKIVLDPPHHLVDGGGFPAQTVHLRPAGDAGLDV